MVFPLKYSCFNWRTSILASRTNEKQFARVSLSDWFADVSETSRPGKPNKRSTEQDQHHKPAAGPHERNAGNFSIVAHIFIRHSFLIYGPPILHEAPGDSWARFYRPATANNAVKSPRPLLASCPTHNQLFFLPINFRAGKYLWAFDKDMTCSTSPRYVRRSPQTWKFVFEHVLSSASTKNIGFQFIFDNKRSNQASAWKTLV